jgi:hypothetical protein
VQRIVVLDRELVLVREGDTGDVEQAAVLVHAEGAGFCAVRSDLLALDLRAVERKAVNEPGRAAELPVTDTVDLDVGVSRGLVVERVGVV